MNLDRFVGMPYRDDFDCADFVAHVRRELFGHEVQLPNGRPRGTAGQGVLGEMAQPYGIPTDAPADGDLVLMREPAGWHVGLYFFRDHEGWVLHSNERNGCSVMHRIRELPDWGLTVAGYYAWA